MRKAYTYIRYSTPEQAKGDSVRRQEDLIEKYVRENGLELQESAAFKDLGVSSFRGANTAITSGLGLFLAEISQGKVPAGSVLIVESIDRLSRQKPVESLNLLMGIVRKGVSIVSLADSGIKEINGDAGLVDLIMTISAISRAHEESLMKSKRISAAWERKRATATQKILTSLGPKWLRIKEDMSGFELVPERAKIVQRVFKLSADGWGRRRIAKQLNIEKIPSFSTSNNGWHSSSIAKILTSRGAIGFYQPHHKVVDNNQKQTREPIGDEIPNYYPSVVTETLFNRVQHRNVLQPKPLVGRQGPQLSNLFTGMIICGWCGDSMNLIDKGKPPKGGKYLVCSAARRGKKCTYKSWRYNQVEDLILAYARQVDYAAVLGGTDVVSELTSLSDASANLLALIEKNEKKLTNMRVSISDSDGAVPKSFLSEMVSTESALERYHEELQELTAKKEAAVLRKKDPRQFASQLMHALDEMDNADDERKYLLRVRLRSQLAGAIEKIEVRARTADELKEKSPPKQRTIKIYFHDGSTRTIVPIGQESAFTLDIP